MANSLIRLLFPCILIFLVENSSALVTGRLGMRFESVDRAVEECDSRSSRQEKFQCFASYRQTYDRDRQIYWVRYVHAVPPVIREMLNEDCPVARARSEAAQAVNEFRAFRCMRRRLQSRTYRYAGAQDAIHNLDNFLRSTVGVGRTLHECQQVTEDTSQCGSITNLPNPNTIPGPDVPLTGQLQDTEGADPSDGSGSGDGSPEGEGNSVVDNGVDEGDAQGSQFSDGETNTLPTQCRYLLGSNGAINFDVVVCPNLDDGQEERQSSADTLPRPLEEGIGQITVSTWIDHLRREAMKRILDRIREEFGNDSRYHNFRDGQCVGVQVGQLHRNCRNPDVLQMINQRACAPVDESQIFNRRRHERSTEFAKTERHEAQRALDILERAREAVNTLTELEEYAARPMPQFEPREHALREEFRESQRQARARLPGLRQQVQSYREQLNAIQATFPQLFVEGAEEMEGDLSVGDSFSRIVGTDRTQPGRDQFPISRHLRSIASASDEQLDRVIDQNRRARAQMLDNAWQSLNALCDENSVRTEDLVLNEALTNSVLADPAMERQFGNLQRQCLAPTLDASRRTREGLKVAALISCGVVAAGVGVATAGAGFFVGLGCGMASVGVASADYGTAAQRYAWVSQCRSIMVEDQSVCTNQQYLAAREQFRQAWDNLVVESTSLAVFDVALGGIGDLLGALPPGTISEFASRLRGIDPSSPRAAEQLQEILSAIRREAGAIDEEAELLADGRRAAQDTGAASRGERGASEVLSDSPQAPTRRSVASNPSEPVAPPLTITQEPHFDLRPVTRPDPPTVRATPAEGESLGGLFLSNARERYARYTPADIAAHNARVRQFVESAGLSYDSSHTGVTLWDEARNLVGFTPTHAESPTALRIVGRRQAGVPTGPRHPMTSAIFHPEFDDVVEQMARIGDPPGVAVYVDPSLSLQRGPNSYGAVFNRGPPPRIIIDPDQPYHLFLHEAQHARFYNTVGREWEQIEAMGKLSPECIAHFGSIDPAFAEALRRYQTHPDFAEAFEMARSGHTRGGIDETLATRVQSRALIDAGYSPLNPEVMHADMYGLRQQITTLENLQSSGAVFTDANRQALETARRQLAVNEHLFALNHARLAQAGGTYSSSQIAAMLAGGTAASAVAGATGAHIYFNRERGNYALTRPDGSVQILTAEEIERLLPDDELEQVKVVDYNSSGN